jgi:O-antigen ligase
MFSKYSKGWIESYWKIMIFFSFIHSICTVVFYLIPGFYTNYIIKIFGNTFYSSLIGWYKQGYATGLATHYSQNGIYLAIATGVAFCTLINNQRNRILNILFFTLCFIALLMSGKRGPLVFALLAMFFTYYVFTSNKPIRRLFKSFFMLGFILAAFLFIQAYIPVLANTLDRFTTTTGDFTGGRLELYRFAWKWFMESPLLGIGWGGYPYRINYTYIGLIYGQNTNMYVHNVYLQLLCEVGILGFVFFVTCIGLTLFKSIKMLMNYKKGKCIYNRIDTYCLTISLFIQLFFVLYSLSGNALYDYPILYPYLLSCAIPITIDYTLKKRGVHNDRNINLLQYH